MRKPYTPVEYEISLYRYNVGNIITLSSDRENAYVPSDSIWKDFEFDDDDD